MIEIEEKEPKVFDNEPKEITIDDAKRYYNAKYLNNGEVYDTDVEDVIKAGIKGFAGSLKKLPTELRMAGGQALYASGEQMKENAEYRAAVYPKGNMIFNGNLGVKLGDKLMESGKYNIITANRNLETLNREIEADMPHLSAEDRNSWTMMIAEQGLDYGVMLGLSYINPVLGMGYMGTKIFGQETEEGAEAYKKKFGTIEGFEKLSGDELTLNVGNVAVQEVFERAFGAPAQLKRFKTMKDFSRAFFAGFGEEFLTENLQNVSDAVFDHIGKRLEEDETILTRIQDNFKGTLVAGLFGGTAGTAFAISNRAKGISDFEQLLEGSDVPVEDRNTLATDLYESGVNNLQEIVTKELELNSQLRAKHGQLYDNLKKQIDRQVRATGAFQGKSESEIAQYLEGTAKQFADNVLAEAQLRNSLIDDVVNKNDIVYEKGRLRLAPKLTSPRERTYNPERMSLLTYLKYKGGLKDVGGDLKAMDAGKQVIGLINNKSGRSLDDAAMDAWESGYFPQFPERPSVNDLLNAISDSLGGRKIYRESYRQTIKQKEDRNKATIAQGELDDFLSDFFSQEDIDSMSQDDKQRFYSEIQEQSNAVSEDEYIDQEYNALTEDEQERYSLMRENGASHEDAIDEIRARRDPYDAVERRHKLQEAIEKQKQAYADFEAGKISMEELNKADEELEKANREFYGDGLFELYQKSMDIAEENARLDDIYPAYEGETITINGQEKTVYNSNGDRIAKSKEALENFYNWFGDSKVVDEQGRPKVMYHGTPNAIYDTLQAGTYFTDNKDYAEVYKGQGASSISYKKEAQKPGVYAVYLKMEKPFDTRNKEARDDFYKYYYQQMGMGTDLTERGLPDWMDGRDLLDFITEEHPELGYDGLILDEGGVGGYGEPVVSRGFSYVTARDDQVKSTSNRGTYSESDNIYYQSAFAGSRVDYDRPSLEAIGSGEGAQAHGWGLYYALNKDVAESYRSKFLGFDELTVKNQDRIKEIINSKGRKFYQESLSNLDELLKKNRELNTKINGLSDEIENLEYENFVSKNGEPESYTFDFKPNKDLYKTTQAEELEKEQNKLIKENESVQESINKIKNDFDELSDLTFNLLNNTEEINWMREIINNVDNKGQVHEVDIPENPYLLDEQKSYREQSDFVKQAIQEIDRELQYPERKEKIFDNKDDAIDFYDSKIDEFEEKANGYQRFFPESFVTDDGKYGVKYVDDYTINEPLIGDYSEITGEGIYSRIARQLGSQKAASELLEKHGVKGITYFGRQDGRCFVIFNPADVKVIQKFYQKGKKIKGAFDKLTKSIKITKDADFSTYQHEFAHFWLDNIWDYVNSGQASADYLKRFDAIKKWLDVKPNQSYFTRAQHEKFARGYEKFLYQGKAVNPIIASAFDDYEKFIRDVYDDITEIDTRADEKYEPLTREAYNFFNSMVSGELTPPANLPDETIEQARQTVEKSETDAKEVVAEESKVLEENRANYKLEPVKTDTKTSYLSAYEKMTGEKVEAGVAELDKEMAKANEFVANNLELAEKIVNGEAPTPENMLKNTIYLAYQDMQKKLGNTEKRANALLNQAQELRAYGQEIASQKLAYADQSTPLYWLSRVMSARAESIAEGNKMTVSELQDYINNEIKGTEGDEKAVDKAVKTLAENLGIRELYQTEKVDLSTKDGVYKYVTSKLGIIPTQEQTAEIVKRADDMLNNLNNAQTNGNPTVDYFVKYKDLENYANSIAPSNRLRVLVSVVGKGNLLASFKSPNTNIVANVPVAALQASLRRQKLGVAKSIVDPELIRQNKKQSWEIYRKTGYQLNNMTDVSPKGLTLGEKITHSQGEGLIRKIGRIYENVIYKWSLGAPDLLFKDFAFNDYVALAATKESGGNVAKANEIYKDVVKIMPQTELGQRIRQEAIEDSLVSTYQNNGKISESALKIRKSMDFGVGFGEFIAPFVKTPANVVGMGLDTAFGGVRALTSEIIRDVKAGKVLTPKSENVRLVVQNGLGLLVASLLLGAIDDDDYMPSYALATNKDKQLAKELNIPYNSIRIGDTWYSMDYLGPLASPVMGLLQARREDGIINSVMGYVKSGAIQTLSIPAFGNVGDLNEKIQNVVRKDGVDALEDIGSQVIEATIARSVPSIVSDIAKVLDENDREAKTLKEKLQAKTPILREKLPEKYNVTTGKVMPRSENTIKRVLIDLFAGARVKEQVVNDMADELFRLNSKGYGVGLTDITRSGLLSTVDSDKKALVKKDFAQMYSKGVQELIKTYRYRHADDEDKKDMIDSLRRKYVNELKKKYLKKSKR